MPTLVELIDLLRLDARRVKAEAKAESGRRRTTDMGGGVRSDIADMMAIPNAVLVPGFEGGVR